MAKRTIIFCFLFFLVGCLQTIEERVSTIREQLVTMKPGMTKDEVDMILQDEGRWVGSVETMEGPRKIWGYPRSAYNPEMMFSYKPSKRFYLFFNDDKFVKFTENFKYFDQGDEVSMPGGGGSPVPRRGSTVPADSGSERKTSKMGPPKELEDGGDMHANPPTLEKIDNRRKLKQLGGGGPPPGLAGEDILNYQNHP